MHTAVDEYDVIYLYVDEPPGFWKFSIHRIFDVLSPLDMNGYMSTWEMQWYMYYIYIVKSYIGCNIYDKGYCTIRQKITFQTDKML